MAARQRVLALDVGQKRIGVAYGDSDTKIAVPSGVILNDDKVIDEIAKLTEQKAIDIVVLGLPRNSQGEETQQSQLVRAFGQRLAGLGRPVVFQDESLTSVEAEVILQQKRCKNYNIRDKAAVDAQAAALILSDYLEANYGRA
jgi:putative Holliday junction resolvase